MYHVSSPAPFRFNLGQRLALTCTGEIGDAIARSEHATSEPQYLLRYRAADGRATEAWWAQSALEPCDGILSKIVDDGGSDSLIARIMTTTEPGLASATGAPRIGEAWPEQGGIYAGLARGVDGQPDHHLILCPAKPTPETLAWQAAMDWAGALQDGDCADWVLPTRAESALLFANLRDQFVPRWHWTCEQYSRNGAWLQYFDDGGQDYDDESYEGHARAVRRLVIQPFIHS